MGGTCIGNIGALNSLNTAEACYSSPYLSPMMSASLSAEALGSLQHAWDLGLIVRDDLGLNFKA